MKTKDVIFIIIILVLGYGIYHFYNQSDINRNNERAAKAELKIMELENGQLYAEKISYKVTERELRDEIYVKDDSLQLMIKKYKDFVGTVIIKTRTKLDTVYVELQPKNEFNERPFHKLEPHYQISGVVGLDYVRLDSLLMWNTQRLIIGRKKGFWNRTITASVSNSNPYIQTVDLSSQVVLEERIKRFGIGPFLGLDFLTFRTVVGLSLNYDLIRF